MVLQIHARIKNGVLIPAVPIGLPDQDDVIVTLSSPVSQVPATDIRDDPNDPCPAEGSALLDWFSRHRIHLDPDILQDIIESDAYIDQEPNDEP